MMRTHDNQGPGFSRVPMRQPHRARKLGQLYAHVHIWLAGSPDTSEGIHAALSDVARDDFEPQPKIRDVRFVLRKMLAEGTAVAALEHGKAPVYRLRSVRYVNP